MKIGFIGYGNMGRAILKGLLAKNTINAENVYACARRFDVLCEKTAEDGINALKTPVEVVEKADVIILAVKPYQMEEILCSIKNQLKGKIVVSIAAGLEHAWYKELLGNDINIISTIPNVPIAVGEGIIVCEEEHSLDENQLQIFKELFSSISLIHFATSKNFSTAGTVAGCGPAFVAMFIEALGDAGVKYGLDRKSAYELAAKMISGTSMLYLIDNKHPAEIKDSVCSPGGTTIKGVSALEENKFRNAVISSIDAIEGK